MIEERDGKQRGKKGGGGGEGVSRVRDRRGVSVSISVIRVSQGCGRMDE